MKIKEFFKKYWDISLVVLAFLLIYLMSPIFSTYTILLLKVSHIALWAGVIGMAYNAYKIKDNRILRILLIGAFLFLYFVVESLRVIFS